MRSPRATAAIRRDRRPRACRSAETDRGVEPRSGSRNRAGVRRVASPRWHSSARDHRRHADRRGDLANDRARQRARPPRRGAASINAPLRSRRLGRESAARHRPRTTGPAVPWSGTSRSARRAARPTSIAADLGEMARDGLIDESAAASSSRCAAPTGSLTISSIKPSSSRSGAVIFKASAASTFRFASRQRMAAHAFGRDDAVDAEFLHEDAVADRNAERATAARLPR